MSPELVDQTILACCKPRFHKVARIIIDVATALKVPLPMERIFVDPPETFEGPMDTGADFIAERIKALVKTERLEAAGNFDRWRYSEVRLTGKETNGA
jgi:hypothetical protein